MGQRLDPLLHLVVDIGEGELSPLAMHRLRDAPGDRAIGRHPYDERALAGQKSHGLEPPRLAMHRHREAGSLANPGAKRGGGPDQLRRASRIGSLCPARIAPRALMPFQDMTCDTETRNSLATWSTVSLPRS